MSNAWLVALILAAAAACASERAVAQSSSPQTDSLLGQVRALDDSVAAYRRTVDSLRRTFVRQSPALIVDAGAVHARTDTALAARARAAVTLASQWVDRRGSRIVKARLDRTVLIVARDSSRSALGAIPTIVISPDTARRWSMIGTRHVLATASREALADAITRTLEQIALEGTDSTLSAWVMVGRVPIRPATEVENNDAYTELATTESAALRQCRARDILACLDVLGVDSAPGARLERWYAPEDYRAVVRTAPPARDDSVAVAAWLRCRHQGDAEACDRAAHALPNARIPLALSPNMRFDFLRHVLDAGGDGAFDRLTTSPGSLRDRLTAAAGEPLDRTVRRWLDDVERSRPDRMHIPWTLAVASLGWSGLIVALALIRRPS